MHLVSFVVFIAMIAYGGYVFMSKVNLESGIVDADTQIANLEEQVTSLEAQSLDNVTVAQSVIASVEASEMIWSGVVSDLLALTPMDIYYVSYSGNEDGSVTVNGFGDSYASVSGLIDAISSEKNFVDAFVPSTAMSSSETGDMASFSLNFTYSDVGSLVVDEPVEVDVPVTDSEVVVDETTVQ